jgi:hypothetical protein
VIRIDLDTRGYAGGLAVYDHPFFGLFQRFFPMVFALDLSPLLVRRIDVRRQRSGGTDGSNLVPSSGESGTNRALGVEQGLYPST